jgi:non-ribosomal peptide synthase protein (TIGR01720 family)
MRHHDALRLAFTKREGIWQQSYRSFENNAKRVFAIVDLESSGKGLLEDLIRDDADHYQRSLSIEDGLVMRVVLLKTPVRIKENRLLIVIHHLSVDGVSWRILLQDLEFLLRGWQRDRKVSLGRKSSSYRQWYASLEEYSRSRRLLSQRNYWQRVLSEYTPLPVDRGHGEITRVKDLAIVEVRLGLESSRRLLQEVPRVYHTEINDILLSALARTLCAWGGMDRVMVGLEGHGREPIAREVDTSRTVGWFTNLYPVLLEAGEGRPAGSLLKEVKEQLRRVPDKGIGYGVLKYLYRQAGLGEGGVPWDIVFNYLGQLDNVVREGGMLQGAGESLGADAGKEYRMQGRLWVNGRVSGGELVLNWSYSGRHYERETIRQLAAAYISNLEGLIDHCMEQGRRGVVFTPSDYGLGTEVSNQELDNFLKRGKNNLDNIINF